MATERNVERRSEVVSNEPRLSYFGRNYKQRMPGVSENPPTVEVKPRFFIPRNQFRLAGIRCYVDIYLYEAGKNVTPTGADSSHRWRPGEVVDRRPDSFSRRVKVLVWPCNRC